LATFANAPKCLKDKAQNKENFQPKILWRNPHLINIFT